MRDGVGLGPVAVGKGPYNACDVRAMEVRVLFARAKSSSPETVGWMSAKRKATIARKRINRNPSRACRTTGCSLQRRFMAAVLLCGRRMPVDSFERRAEGL